MNDSVCSPQNCEELTRRMKNVISKVYLPLVSFLVLSPFYAAAQGSGGFSWGSYGLVAAAVIAVVGAVVVVSENLLKVEAKRSGVDMNTAKDSSSFNLKRILRGSLPNYLSGKSLVELNKGYDIPLVGKAEAPNNIETVHTRRYAIQPPNFRGIRPIPKLEIEEGANVKAGDPIFYDKSNPDIKYVSPVSGEFIELQRGAKRAITNLVFLADEETSYRNIPNFDLDTGSREDLKKHLMATGGWPLFNKRPFDVIADPAEDPKNIFISTFDTAPLALDMNKAVEGREQDFQKGLDVLNRLTDGEVFLGLDGRHAEPPASAFIEAEGVHKVFFKGPHPAGNVGVQIHHIAPISTKDVVWTLDVQNVITLGALFTQQRYMADRLIAICGAQVKTPTIIKTKIGASINEIISGRLQEGDNRIINGDVLCGERKSGEHMFLNANSNQITIIPEGDYYEPFGWLIPNKLRPTVSRTYPNFLIPGLKFDGDTNTHGEKRAFVVTGQYEKLLPMDIYVQHLMKSIMINDFERMEGLGIAELSEEDVALAEFACTSKMPLQKILREGLDYVQSQM
jgi:Na+-transporting NADH:ubiquinone oxidoreductase subunit A